MNSRDGSANTSSLAETAWDGEFAAEELDLHPERWRGCRVATATCTQIAPS